MRDRSCTLIFYNENIRWQHGLRVVSATSSGTMLTS